MIARVIELDNLSEAGKEMLAIGCDKVGVEIMSHKAISRVIKIKNVRPPAANIIKQEMLSFGGEAATAHGAIDQSVDTTDLLIFGTLRQISLLLNKLKIHQFGLSQIGAEINIALGNYQVRPGPIARMDFGERTYIMGILNVTPDSFSDGDKFMDVATALAHAKKMVMDGADIIDVGGESTRPGSKTVSAAEEKKRVLPVIEKLAKETKTLISIDTTKAEVAQAALAAGARMVNDISGLRFDKNMAKVVAEARVPVCLMHMQGNPRNMQNNPVYSDLMDEMLNYLQEGLEIAKEAGILHGQIIVDPGIGFGKTVVHNLEILRRLRELKILGCPILVGASRKSVIGQVLNLPVSDRGEGTSATIAISIANGANIIRVHDVAEMARVAKMADSIVRRRNEND